MLGLSAKALSISPSSTLALTALAKRMLQEGKNVISFGAGEPDFDTPDPIKDAAKKAIDSGFTKYTPADGTLELKQAICEKFAVDNGLKYDPKHIVVSCGAKHSLYNAILAVCDEAEEVIVISPYWVSYQEMIKMAGGHMKVVDSREDNRYKPRIKDIINAINGRTKAIIINSPSNPAGVVLSAKDLQEIADVAVEKNIYVISDEIYEKLIYDGNRHVSIGSLGGKIHSRTITVNGVSKAYSMTGWRIGYTGAPEDVTAAMANIQSHSTSNPVSISQKAALAALKMAPDVVEKMRVSFEKRRDLILKLLGDIPKFRYIRPEGAFYVYCDISGTGMKAQALSKKLLEEKLVAVVPGEDFGSDSHIRFSFAMAEDKIREGITRIKEWVKP